MNMTEPVIVHDHKTEIENPVLCEISEGIATLTLNRPAKLNAINYRMADTLLSHLDAFEVDDSVKVIILTGAGERAFEAMERGFHEQGIMLRITGDTVAVTPPLIISETQIDELFGKLDTVFRTLT